MALAGLICSTIGLCRASDFFQIKVVDSRTGRGVPLVELTTTNDIRYFTDSNGAVAFDEPGLMNQRVFFEIHSDGYEYPADGFGYRGVALETRAGGSATIKLPRTNIAERLYRITGQGIYRDSVLLGLPTPIRDPLLNGQVTGQDTVCTAIYHGKLYWFWGDTNRPSYPLGQFGTSGATSEPPGRGGLDPSLGIDLKYFTDRSGFSRPMVNVAGPGPKWIGGVMVVPDDRGRERLVAGFDRVQSLAVSYERGLLLFDDEKQQFNKLLDFTGDVRIVPVGNPFEVEEDGRRYWYFPSPYGFPAARVPADLRHVSNPKSYEGLSCLPAGTNYTERDRGSPVPQRDGSGRIRYEWKANTRPLDDREQRRLIARGLLKPRETLLHFIDFDTGRPVEMSGSAAWNEYRGRWILIGQAGTNQAYWAEADTPTGPWVYCRRVTDYRHYTMYNLALHPFFDQAGGRLVYFEGTYTQAFSDSPIKTPRYDYNQLMYRLDLSDPRLFLPVAVYRVRSGGGVRHLTRSVIEAEHLWASVESAPFFAFEPDRSPAGAIPLYDGPNGALARTPPVADAKPAFCALGPSATTSEPRTHTDPVTDLREAEPNAGPSTAGLNIWKNPSDVMFLDWRAKPVDRLHG